MGVEMKQVKLIVAGAGGRGSGYARHAQLHPEQLKIVGVAEPRDFYREKIAAENAIPPEHVFKDWREMADRAKFADGVIIATQDKMHTGPSIAFSEKGYHILLEKPMAPSAKDCKAIVDAAIRNKIIFAVCHVLRYTAYTTLLKKIIDSGAIGEIVSMQHLEPVGFWHQAHSFVRGNWRNEKESSFMLLAKSCHDMDWMRYIMGVPCRRVSSFGSLFHFRKECKPAGAASRCIDCGIEDRCPYSAMRIYRKRINEWGFGWPVTALITENSDDALMKAIKEGPYGRCVYECDNDVVDNQVVSMEFEGNRSAVFTMTAFTGNEKRETRIFGTKGRIFGDSGKIRVYDFLTEHETEHDSDTADGTIHGGHGGGDYMLMKGFVEAVSKEDPSKILSGPAETLESHIIAFAAETARKKGRIVSISEFMAKI